MPTRCIALGCTSGYESNPEKVHFFNVPKDENIVALWQTALRRKDFIIKPGQSLCDKHFRKEDILWKREIVGSDGKVLGVSAPYKIPRLRKGAVPSQFPWTEDGIASEERTATSCTNPSKVLFPSENIHVESEETNTEEIMNVDEGTKNVEEKATKIEESSTSMNIEESCNSSPTTLFEDVLRCRNLCVPVQWIRKDTSFNGTNLITFYVTTCSNIEDDEFKIRHIILKEVILNENMNIQVNTLGQPVDLTNSVGSPQKPKPNNLTQGWVGSPQKPRPINLTQGWVRTPKTSSKERRIEGVILRYLDAEVGNDGDQLDTGSTRSSIRK